MTHPLKGSLSYPLSSLFLRGPHLGGGPVHHPPAVIPCFYDFTMMSEPVEHGGGHLLISKDLGPFSKGQVRGDDD